MVTYKGWPLYLFKGDTKNGVANGQDINLTGGYWYVITTTGAVIKHKPTTTTTTTTTTTGGTGTSTTGLPGQGQPIDPVTRNAYGGPDDGDGCL